MNRTLLIAGALPLLAFLSPLSGANLLVNGDFESTTNGYSQTLTPVGWTNVGHTDGVIAYSVFGTPAYNGNYYYDLGGYGGALPASGDGIQQTVATAIGSTYTLTFGFTGENVSGGPESLNVIINGVLVQSFIVPLNAGLGGFKNPFVTQTLNYNASSASSTILFTVTGTSLGSNDPLIDGISFSAAGTTTASPEPATLALAGLSLAGLAAFGRMRHKART